jgi:hypothetical protein
MSDLVLEPELGWLHQGCVSTAAHCLNEQPSAGGCRSTRQRGRHSGAALYPRGAPGTGANPVAAFKRT